MLIRNASRLKAGVPSTLLQELFTTITPAMLRTWVERISIPRHLAVNAEANTKVAEWLALKDSKYRERRGGPSVRDMTVVYKDYEAEREGCSAATASGGSLPGQHA